MSRAASRASLFLVSLFGLSFELFLGRYFTLTLYADYSYWVISVALLGYSFGGVLLTLWRDWFYRRHGLLLLVIPPALIIITGAAFLLIRVNPFNPLQLQNALLWRPQIGNILLFYAALFPVFLLTGTFIGLVFLTQASVMPKVYAMDLLGAAGGAVLTVGALFFVHPIHLPALMLPALLAATVVNALARPRPVPAAATVAVLAAATAFLGVGTWVVLSAPTLTAPDYKQLHAVLGIKSARVELSRISPAGTWLAIDDYTEYEDASMTNNYATVGAGSPPRSLGLFRDGARVAPLVLALPVDTSYLQGSLSTFPYLIRPRPFVLLLGTDGGARVLEAAREGARGGIALEQPGDVYDIVRDRLEKLEPGFERVGGITLRRGTAFALPPGPAQRFDLIDVANDFLGQDANNSWSFTREAVALCLADLAKGGILSIPVDISEVDVYALKLVNTITAALADRGVRDPSRHLIVYRTAWTCRLLVSPDPFSASDISRLVAWCTDRSFDTSWYPGIVPSQVTVWNDLPPVTFDQEQVQVSDAPQDALRDDITAILARGGGAPAGRYFALAPSTMDRPEFYSVSRLAQARSLLNRLEILPEKEIGYLLNLAVLAEALVLALLVIVLPLFRAGAVRRRGAGPAAPVGRVLLYFSALGLGFFFIELMLVKKLSFLLDSATLSFAVVLAGVLVFSGLGSWYAARFGNRRRRALLGALPVIAGSLVVFLFALDPLMRLLIGLPLALRIAAALVLVAPVSFALGRPFALGTSALAGVSDSLVPWAWAINGALSVVATPLASIISVSTGWSAVILAALILYASTALTFPETPRSRPAS